MCYAPTRRSTMLIKRASERITEGKLPEAERLLQAAKLQMGQVVNIEMDGKRVGEWYSDAVKALTLAKRSKAGR